MSRLVAAFILAAGATVASAQDGEPMVYGAGGSSCGKWLQARKDDTYYTQGQWLLGYISAVSIQNKLKKTDSDAMAAWMDKYCAEHPLDNIQKGAEFLVKELYMGPQKYNKKEQVNRARGDGP